MILYTQASSISTTSTATMESPDNDSAFDSDDVSLMSSESSASSGSGMISGQARWVRQVRRLTIFGSVSFRQRDI